MALWIESKKRLITVSLLFLFLLSPLTSFAQTDSTDDDRRHCMSRLETEGLEKDSAARWCSKHNPRIDLEVYASCMRKLLPTQLDAFYRLDQCDRNTVLSAPELFVKDHKLCTTAIQSSGASFPEYSKDFIPYICTDSWVITHANEYATCVKKFRNTIGLHDQALCNASLYPEVGSNLDAYIACVQTLSTNPAMGEERGEGTKRYYHASDYACEKAIPRNRPNDYAACVRYIKDANLNIEPYGNCARPEIFSKYKPFVACMKENEKLETDFTKRYTACESKVNAPTAVGQGKSHETVKPGVRVNE